MPEINNQSLQPEKGEVRIRSNVCTDSNAWHLVPGDLVKSFSLSQTDLTESQQKEMMYYSRCCLCHRTSFEIGEEGCDYCEQRGHGTLSVAAARHRRVERLNQAEGIQF